MSRLLTEPDTFFSYARLYASSVASILAWGFRAKDLDSIWFKDVSGLVEEVSPAIHVKRIDIVVLTHDQWLEAIEPGANPPIDLIPWLWYLPGKWKKRAYRMRDYMDSIWTRARKMVDERRDRGDKRDCMVDMKFDEYNKNGWPMSEHAFNNMFGELMEAGADTTAIKFLP